MKEVDIFGPSNRRGVGSAREKAALLAEVDTENCKVRLVARRHNMSQSLIYNWRSTRQAAAVALVAAMRKLLTILNAIVRDQKPWQKA